LVGKVQDSTATTRKLENLVIKERE
jgi:hypothetical protein